MFQLFSSLSAFSLSSASPDSLRKPNQDLRDNEQPPSEGEIVRVLENMEFSESWEAPAGGVRKTVVGPAMGVLEEYFRTVGRCADGTEGLFVRPAYDGMRIIIRDGEVFDG